MAASSSKVVLVTGGSRGIGAATCIAAARDGWSVGVNYLANKQAADRLIGEIAALGGRATAVPGDVSKEAQIIAAFDLVEAKLGPLQAAVINAGIVAPAAPLVDMSADRITRLFMVNSVGAYLCAREAARRLQRNALPGSSIVLMSSVAVRLGSPNLYVDYAGSKAPLETLTIGLSKELGGSGIRVNAVRPGVIDTEIHASGGQPDRARTIGPTAPLGRAGRAEEVAAAVAWLISEQASYVTGAILDVAGGR